MELKRVVVTGLGALTPIGNNKDAYWEALISGKSGCAPVTYFDTEHFKTKFACELKNFEVTDFLNRKEARKMDRFAQYAMVASDEAIIDAKLDLDTINKLRVGVIWGAWLGLIQIDVCECVVVLFCSTCYGRTGMLRFLSTKVNSQR